MLSYASPMKRLSKLKMTTSYRRALYSLRDGKVIISVLLNVVHFVTDMSLLPRATFRVLPAINSSVLSPN